MDKRKKGCKRKKLPYRLTCPIYPRVIGYEEITEEEKKEIDKKIEEFKEQRKRDFGEDW